MPFISVSTEESSQLLLKNGLVLTLEHDYRCLGKVHESMNLI